MGFLSAAPQLSIKEKGFFLLFHLRGWGMWQRGSRDVAHAISVLAVRPSVMGRQRRSSHPAGISFWELGHSP